MHWCISFTDVSSREFLQKEEASLDWFLMCRISVFCNFLLEIRLDSDVLFNHLGGSKVEKGSCVFIVIFSFLLATNFVSDLLVFYCILLLINWAQVTWVRVYKCLHLAVELVITGTVVPDTLLLNWNSENSKIQEDRYCPN